MKVCLSNTCTVYKMNEICAHTPLYQSNLILEVYLLLESNKKKYKYEYLTRINKCYAVAMLSILNLNRNNALICLSHAI